MSDSLQQLTILGATGSIGVSTLDVVARHPDRYAIFALTAHSRWQPLAEQCMRHKPQYAVLSGADEAALLSAELKRLGSMTEVLFGEDALAQVASHSEVDTVMAAIVGAAGLLPTLAAVNSGKKVLLANKEALVMAGGLFTQAVAESGAVLLPIDSEHNAIFQCMPAQHSTLAEAGVRKILLTGSGGPFRQTPLETLKLVTPDQACAHPNWSMGRKISVDSASMMNKGLELVEACWLFNCAPDKIDIVIHPQSIIHSMVEYRDGSMLAQLGNPDMRTPIAHALAWPERIDSGVASLDIIATARLDFEAPDFGRFPCLRLAVDAAKAGQTAPAILNAANEVAVEAFLAERIRFDQIAQIIDSTLEAIPLSEPESLAVVQEIDRRARDIAKLLVDRQA